MKQKPVKLTLGSRLERYEIVKATGACQLSGRLTPVFGPAAREKEDAYLERMLARDRKLGLV